LTWIVLLASLPGSLPMAAMFGPDAVYKVTYDGGSLPELEAGAAMELYIDSNQIRLLKDLPRHNVAGLAEVITLPASSVTEVSYGQDVHRRVGTAVAVGIFTLGIGALTALSKSKKHFVGLTWVDGDKKGGLAMQCDKKDYRGVLAGLEGVTGMKAVDSETMTVKN
jgi:hypothetical protein